MNRYLIRRRTDGLLVGHAYIVIDRDADDIEFIKTPKEKGDELLTDENSLHIADNCNIEAKQTNCIEDIEGIVDVNRVELNDQIDHEVDQISSYSYTSTNDSNATIFDSDILIDNLNSVNDFSQEVDRTDLTPFKHNNNVSINKESNHLEKLRKPFFWGFQRVCRFKKNSETGKIRVTSARYISPQVDGTERMFTNNREVEEVIRNIPELKLENFSFSLRIHELGEDFEIVKESNMTTKIPSDNLFKNPEELKRYIKILDVNTNYRSGRALCYFCNLVICQSYLKTHMKRYHLPRNICFRCGEDKSEGLSHYFKNRCNNSKVEFSKGQGESGSEEGSSKYSNESMNNESSLLPPAHCDGEDDNESLIPESVDFNKNEENSVMRENNGKNKEVEETENNIMSDENDLMADEDIVVIIVMILEGRRNVRMVTKSKVKMRKIMRRFGKRMGLDWRKLSFTDEEGREQPESVSVGNLTSSIIKIQWRGE